MGLPSKKRTSTSKKDRSSHFALKTISTKACASCGKAVRPHQACLACGAYKGKTVVNTTKRTTRLAKKLRKIS